MRRALLGVTAATLLIAVYLSGQGGVAVTRMPYLQSESYQGIVVRWRTSLATDSRVCYGSSPAALTSCVSNPASSTEHVVTLAGLAANTTYYYSVGSTSAVQVGGDPNQFFVTSPAPGTAKPTRVWVLGDSGTADANAAAVRDAYYAFTGTRHTDLWLMLGDNAYSTGTDAEYQAAVFNMYGAMLRKSALWPTLGNHDGATADSATQTGPYYDIFTLPRGGEAGGMPSATEAYYSFDYGNIHFICLESFETNRVIGSPMMNWLQSDLNATTKDWIVAFWHHPPYSKGSHNSDTETQLIEMRENAVKVLEASGVDLVLTGHSHSYERSYLIDGHYGVSSTFNSTMQKDAGSGRENGTGAYKKPVQAEDGRAGAVYAVAGSSGQASGGTLNHPAMYISLNKLGSMVLDIDGNRLDAKFLDNTGVVQDFFTILKGTPVAPSNLTASAVSSSQINLAWQDNSSNELNFKVERSTNGTTFAEIAVPAAGSTTYSDSGLAVGTTYSYRVRASNSVGNSPYSNTASASTSSGAPAAPSNLTATVSGRQVNLAWNDNSSNETGFHIERCSGNNNCNNFAPLADTGVNVHLYAESVSPGRYRYRVRAFNAAGNSAYSNIVNARVK